MSDALEAEVERLREALGYGSWEAQAVALRAELELQRRGVRLPDADATDCRAAHDRVMDGLVAESERLGLYDDGERR